VTVEQNGEKIDAVAQPTKGGLVFLFDRTNGKPLFPIEEITVPNISELKGEKLSPTQPWLIDIEPFARQRFTEKDVNPFVSKEEQEEIRLKLQSLSTGFTFNPPTKKGTVIFPGYDGGAEWGGPAYDPETNLLYINSNEMPWILTMVEQQENANKTETNFSAGKRLYQKNCMSCHGVDQKGSGNNPSLAGVEKKYSELSFTELIKNGRRMMPAFAQLHKADLKALASYVLLLNDIKELDYNAADKELNPYWEMPYTSTGYNKFLTKDGYPAISPPWGTLNAIDLNTGKIVWKIPIGDTEELKEKGFHTGTENYGGPMVTAGGLVFLAATKDGMFRAFNKKTGALLWETKLPFPGFATPSTYTVEGKQYIVIACGGGKLDTASGDAYLAFAL
jgi:quinoprotein glucose dehydrogenase